MQKSILATAVALLVSQFPVYAKQPNIGDSVEGGFFLYREQVEMYRNDWMGFPLITTMTAATRQAQVTIVGEGKTADFIRNLSINCENGKHFWKSAGASDRFLAS